MLTEKQIAFLEICEKRQGDPDFSDLTCNDVAEELGWDINVTKGVLGSLCAEDYLYVEHASVNGRRQEFIWINSIWRNRHLLHLL